MEEIITKGDLEVMVKGPQISPEALGISPQGKIV